MLKLPRRVGSILWRRGAAAPPEGNRSKRDPSPKGRAGIGGTEKSRKQLPITQSSPARVSTRSDGWLQGSCSRKRAGLPRSQRAIGVVVLCPLRSGFTKDHRGDPNFAISTCEPPTSQASEPCAAFASRRVQYAAHRRSACRAPSSLAPVRQSKD
jgi:hypothetical protein